MLRLAFVGMMAGLLAGSAWAAEGGAAVAPGSSVQPGPGGVQAAWSYAKNDRIMKCLTLTDEQVAKIDALFKDLQTGRQELYKGVDKKMGKEAYAAIQEKMQALQTAFDAKVLDVLTAEQKVKYEAALKIMAESQKAIQELLVKFNAGDKTADDRKALSEAMKKINSDRDEALVKLLGEAYKSVREGVTSGMNVKP
jgi:Spy/CpxP family protein refolding chaperone